MYQGWKQIGMNKLKGTVQRHGFHCDWNGNDAISNWMCQWQLSYPSHYSSAQKCRLVDSKQITRDAKYSNQLRF